MANLKKFKNLIDQAIANQHSFTNQQMLISFLNKKMTGFDKELANNKTFAVIIWKYYLSKQAEAITDKFLAIIGKMHTSIPNTEILDAINNLNLDNLDDVTYLQKVIQKFLVKIYKAGGIDE